MQIGVALPQMALGYGPETTVSWARRADAGPFSSISAGERVTFSNPEMVASLAAAAAVTTRLRIFANLWVLPVHAMAMVAQQVSTLDQLSGGRLSVAVGVGAREEDYRALGSPFTGRHGRLDAQVAELRRLLAGEPPYDGAEPVGPPPTRPGGPELLAGAMGPKAMRRAAAWADGVSAFSLSGDPAEIGRTNELARACWSEAGRPAPRTVNGTFFALGVADPLATLKGFAARYLGFLGSDLAGALAGGLTAATRDDVARILDGAEAAGCDEFVMVPATTDLGALDELAELPILDAISYPQRLPTAGTGLVRELNWPDVARLNFETLDMARFPCFRLALEAARSGGTYPCVLVGADEEAVALFLNGKIRLVDIAELIETVLARHQSIVEPDMATILDACAWARRTAQEVYQQARFLGAVAPKQGVGGVPQTPPTSP